MKKTMKLYMAAALLAVVSPAILAQAPVKVVCNELKQKGNELVIDAVITVDGNQIKSRENLSLTPVLESASQKEGLPSILLNGRISQKVYDREIALNNLQDEPRFLVVQAGKSESVINYKTVIPFESWMKDARLDMQRDECGCGETALMNIEEFGKVTLERVWTPYVVVPQFAYLQPKAEEIKQRDIQAECFLDFEVNKVNIRPEYMNNPQELAKIRKMIDELKSDPNVKVNRLDIIGYASPEGTLAANKRLSEGRAMALRDYLAYRYDFPRNQYYIVFGGENWDGLEKALETIELEYKDEVLDIIRNIPIEKGRETKLMQLHGGTPYRYLLKYIFPSLRVAICKVNYEVRDFSVEEAKEIIKTRPQNLSLNEMFLVANTYPTGSQEFIDVFETAVRMYPQSEIANINAATAALSRNDLVSAERYLSMVNSNKNLPEYNNAMGILMLMKGDYELSKKYLKVAEQSGLDAARGNLEELVRKKANAAEMRKNGK